MTIPLFIYAIMTKSKDAWKKSSDTIIMTYSSINVVISFILAFSLYRIARVISRLEQVRLNKSFVVVHVIGLLTSALSGLVLGYYQYKDVGDNFSE